MLKGSTMSSICVADAVNQDNSIGNDDFTSPINPVTTLEDDDFDDFADFQEASPLVNDETINTPSDGEQDVPLPNSEPKKQDSASPLPSPSSSSLSSSSSIFTSSTGQKIASNQSTVKTFPTLDKIINQSFTKATEDYYVESEQTITSDLFNDKSSQSYKMWENLLNPEESTSFRLNWESSHTFQVFLRSLKIDNKNVDNFFVAFESSSESDEHTMSSPVSSTSQSSDNQIVTKISNTEMTSQTSSSSSSSSSLPPSSVILPTTTSTSTQLSPQIVPNCTESMSQKQEPSAATSKTTNTNSSASFSSLSSSSSSSSSSTKPNTESNDSTNQSDEIQPSTNNQLSNNLLDVTFFLNNPNFMQPCSSPKASVKVNESEQSIQGNESSTKPLSIISSSSTDPFHNLISHIQDASSMRSTTTKSQSTTKSLTPSESTNRIFDELPLLSFMRTKLLMFPMRDSIKD